MAKWRIIPVQTFEELLRRLLKIILNGERRTCFEAEIFGKRVEICVDVKKAPDNKPRAD